MFCLRVWWRWYSQLRLLGALERDVHGLRVGVARGHLVAVLHVAVRRQQRLDVVKPNMQREPTDENL